MPATRVAIPQHVVHRTFPTETVLLNLNTGQYHGLNPTAGRMFEVLGEDGSLEQAANRLAEEFSQPLEAVEHDLRDLCTGLIGRGLLEPAAG
jgi:hypothetical protein